MTSRHLRSSLLLLLLSRAVHAQDPTTTISGSISGTITGGDVPPSGPSVSYISYSSTSTPDTTTDSAFLGSITAVSSGMGDANTTTSSGGSTSQRTVATTEPTVTYLTGSNSEPTVEPCPGSLTLLGSATAANATACVNGTLPVAGTPSVTTSAGPEPTNTQPCNNYVEFCTRAYGNITEVCAHNSPFVRPNNAASNQKYPVTVQLDNGIRMLQGQTHMLNGTLHFCHTSCDLLDAGPVEDYLATVAGWMRAHPFEVVTILLGNADFVAPTDFVAPIKNSGILPFLYEPPLVPMGRGDWPQLQEMILRGRRVVMFLDYNANQEQVPYLLDEFSQMWETPFSPTDPAFPCTVQRPPGLDRDQANGRLYMANHNLNLEVSIAGTTILVPNTVDLNRTNNVSGPGSLGAMAQECDSDWGQKPNFLLVDYYNVPNGSVFEVAAQQNNVTYTGRCCGPLTSAAAPPARLPSTSHLYAALATVCGVVALLGLGA